MGKRVTDLTPSDKNLIAQLLIENSTNGKVHKGKQAELAASFGVCARTIKYIWSAVKQQQLAGKPVMFTSNKKGISHNGKYELDVELMKSIPFSKRSTIRKLAKGLNCSKSTVGRWVKCGIIKPHTNAIKSFLTDANKVQRLKYSLHSLEAHSHNNKFKFQTMHNVVHIDEKWFYMTTESERSYKLEEETDPYRSCLCAVARPVYSSDGTLLFDGKIGIFPFTKQEPAQRNSKNRVRGTMVTKAIESINKEVIKDCLINQIIPAIKAKWPASASKHILIQQDNARPHINNFDPQFRATATSDGFNIQLICQPPNSPDTNVCDLGWFRALQSLQDDTTTKNVDELVANVFASYEELEDWKLNNVFLSLQNCMIEIMMCKGHNNFKLPHMYKEGLMREGRLPLTLEVDEALVRDCIEYLMHGGHMDQPTYDLEGLVSSLGYA